MQFFFMATKKEKMGLERQGNFFNAIEESHSIYKCAELNAY